MPRVRDVRVDRIGFVNELVNQYIGGDDGVKAKVKAALQPGHEAYGDFFEAALVAAHTNEVSPSALMKLYESRQITRAQFIECISVSAPQVGKLGLPLKVVRRLVKTWPATPRLVVNRLKGIQFELKDAVTALHGAIAGDAARAAVAQSFMLGADGKCVPAVEHDVVLEDPLTGKRKTIKMFKKAA